MKTYDVRTHGCQMNVHDSERLAGLLEQAGFADIAGLPAQQRPETADVVVFNTCAVRENAANKLYGNLGQLRPDKARNPEMQIAVGGCLAQHEREEIVRRAPWVDVVFGTHNMDALPVLLERARHNRRAQVEIREALQVFPSVLPSRRDSAYSAWVSISVGCNNTCSFCIVPALRGREQDRPPEDIVAEVKALVRQGVIEVTLLGQNVNTYGVQFGDRFAFGRLLRACGSVDGLERLRFTSPHPAAFTTDVIEAMAQTPTVMPSLHMPLQSGSDRVLRRMRRSYRAERFLDIVREVRTHIPDAAVTTDIIVGFPGETDADFEDTLTVVSRARFASAFTFQYSSRPGTPAATMPDQIPKQVVQERFDRLIALQEGISWEANRAFEGTTVEVLVAPGEGRKDGRTARLSGRARDNRLVHFSLPTGDASGPQGSGPRGDRSPTQGEALRATGEASPDRRVGESVLPRPGDVVEVAVTYGAPHHLVADSALTGGPFRIRRTPGGQAWQDAQANPVPGRPPVTLGMPGLGRPSVETVPPPAGCRPPRDVESASSAPSVPRSGPPHRAGPRSG